MIQRAMESMKDHVVRRMWVLSDLQQSIPEQATACMTAGVEDFKTLNLMCDGICYLGDAIEGSDLSHLEEMTAMQIEKLGALKLPVYYVMGNHDFDYLRVTGQVRWPFYETVAGQENWHVAPSPQSVYFIEDVGPYAMVFFNDHGAADGSWFTTHGVIHGESQLYPYEEEMKALWQKIAAINKPVFTLSHYPFPGGNRPSDLLARLMPLPDNVRMHLYGHAHIGDGQWAGKDLYRKIACVDNQQIPQINVASLENRRGSAVRSAIWEYYDDGSTAVFFRNHTEHQWDEMYVQRAMPVPPARVESGEKS